MTATDPRLAALHEKYPKAYPRPDRTRSPWAFDSYGFQCGPGWAQILDKLGPVLELHSVHVHQIKEKFGGLRVYTEDVPNEVTAAIDEAERSASYTCEMCGAFGSRCQIGYWLKTYCRGCRQGEHARIAHERGLVCIHVAAGVRGAAFVHLTLEPFPEPAAPAEASHMRMVLACDGCATAAMGAAGKAIGLELS